MTNESFCPNCAGAGVYRKKNGNVAACPACRATGTVTTEPEQTKKPEEVKNESVV